MVTSFNTNPAIAQEEHNLRQSDPDLQQEESDIRQGSNLPLATTAELATSSGDNATLPTGADSNSPNATTFRIIPLRMGGSGGTHMPSAAIKQLFETGEVSLADLENLTTRFYDKAFLDATLDKFIRSHHDPHAARFAKWIHQKLSGSNIWDVDRQTRDKTPVRIADKRLVVVHDRSSAHVAAWFSPKRPSHHVGRHFKVDECRVWMRLHFWAMREAGLIEKSPTFADYYVRFIGHFVRVYEGSAPMFARDSLRWSEDQSNIDRYLKNGRKMTDVLGLKLNEAFDQLPESESDDFEWPYNESATSSLF